MPDLAAAYPVELDPSTGVEGYRLVSPSGRLSACIAPSRGAELSSLVLRDYGELLYRANDYRDPPEGQWRGRAPFLWPAVGRNFTDQVVTRPDRQCCFEHQGIVYDLPIHGFARDAAWGPVRTVSDVEAAELTVLLADSRPTREIYPWSFRLRLTHRLTDEAYTAEFHVDSANGLWFGLGNHITLALPTESYDETRVTCTATRRLELNEYSLLNGEETPVELWDAFLAEDAMLNAVFGGIEGHPVMRVEIPDGPCVVVQQDVSEGGELVSPEDRLFVVYGDRAKGYYCPEPWLGRPNGLQTGSGVVKLPPATPFCWTMTVAVED